MYRDGSLPCGEPMKAVIHGDIAVTGTQVVCASCHRRSGYGASEGAEVAPPVTGAYLYAPGQRGDKRLAMPVGVVRRPYTDETLKRAIRAAERRGPGGLAPRAPVLRAPCWCCG